MKGQCHNNAELVINKPEVAPKEAAEDILRLGRERSSHPMKNWPERKAKILLGTLKDILRLASER
jgi:hypothetical protein